jgi:kinetochore protein Spc25
MQTAISTLTSQKSLHETHRARLRAEIAATQSTIRQRREAQAAHQRALDAQARHNIPELRFWETCLGLRIEGTESGGSKLRFCFEELGMGGEEEGWFEIDTGAVGFEVVRTEPRLEGEEVEGVVERANEARDLVLLLKGMRGGLVQALKG